MPQINIVTNEVNAASGIPSGTGTAFIAGSTDAGPLPGGAGYVRVASLTDFINNFGPRSTTNATVYDWLDEFFGDGGTLAYVARVDNGTGSKANLILRDGAAASSVVVSALTSGVGGNSTYVDVDLVTGPSFTASAGSNQATISSVSSFVNLGVGTFVTGPGIAANTFVSAINAASAQATLSTAVGSAGAGTNVSLTPVGVNVLVKNSAGVTLEAHGPFYTTASILADTTSFFVAFTAGASNSLPIATLAVPLAGGANPTGTTDTDHVNALASFQSALGAGTVALPGKTSTTAWTGLLAHGAANNRFAVLDMVDSSSVPSIIGQAQGLGSNGNASYGMFIQGSAILPGITPNTTRTVAGSAPVAAVIARVANTNTNRAPAGPSWPMSKTIGFTQYFGPVPSLSSSPGSFAQSDVNALSAAGVNVFANYYGALCLFGFVTPVAKTADAIFWEATASRERMTIAAKATVAMAPYLFSTIDGAGLVLADLNGDLQAILHDEWASNSIYGDSVQDAGSVLTGPPVNTAATAAAGQLNAQIYAKLSPYADTVNLTISIVQLTQQVPQPSGA